MIALAGSCPAIDFCLTPFAGSCLAVGQRGLAIELGLGTFVGTRPTILRGPAPVCGRLSPGQCCTIEVVFSQPCRCGFGKRGSLVPPVTGVVPLLGNLVSLVGRQVTLVAGLVSPVASLVAFRARLVPSGAGVVSPVAGKVSPVSGRVSLVGSFVAALTRFVSTLAGLISADPLLVPLFRI